MMRRTFIPVKDMSEGQLEEAYRLIDSQLSEGWKDWVPNSTGTVKETTEWELWGVSQDVDGAVTSVTVLRKFRKAESRSGTILA